MSEVINSLLVVVANMVCSWYDINLLIMDFKSFAVVLELALGCGGLRFRVVGEGNFFITCNRVVSGLFPVVSDP